MVKWLNDNAEFAKLAVASGVVDVKKGTDFLRITSKGQGDVSKIEVLDTALATKLGFKVGEVLAIPGSYAYVDLRLRTDPLNEDARIKRVLGASGRFEYVLDDVEGLAPGTYTIFVQVKMASDETNTAKINFQIGTETPEAYPAFGCNDCHAVGDNLGKFHGSYPLDPDVCKSCHDNKRQRVGYSKWTTSNNGYGAAPLSRRIHGVHFGAYTDKPLEIHSSWGVHFSTLIFPQDVRNCTKCHQDSSSWTEKPGRVPCLGCHDTDKAISHAALQTWDMTPEEPYSGDEVETCGVCHGADSDFAADIVHNVWSPYKPPYPRHHEHD